MSAQVPAQAPQRERGARDRPHRVPGRRRPRYSAASCASRLIAGAARRSHDPDLLRAPVAIRALAAAGRDRALGRGRPRASRRPPTVRRGSSSGGRSRPGATCCWSTCAAPAGRSRSTARRSGTTSSATSPAPPAALLSSGRRATPTTRRSRCRIWPPCCAPSTSAASTSTATPTARTRRRRSRSAIRGSCARSCSTAPISCPAPTRRWPTSPPARGARCGWRAAAGPDARPGAPTR